MTQAGVMLIPAEIPPLDDKRHLTLVWAGDDVDTATVLQLRTIAARLAVQFHPFTAGTWGLDLFGEGKNEPVIRVSMTGEIALMRSALVSFSKSEFTEFKPHVAIPILTNQLPRMLYFHKIAVWHGEDHSWERWLGTSAHPSRLAGARTMGPVRVQPS